MASNRHCSVAITFGGGNGTVLPALHGYIGHITVADGGVSNVTLCPLEQLDALAAVPEAAGRNRQAAQRRLGGGQPRRRCASRKIRRAAFAERVRVEKQFDPTLGLYAAYAYAEAGLYDEVQSGAPVHVR